MRRTRSKLEFNFIQVLMVILCGHHFKRQISANVGGLWVLICQSGSACECWLLTASRRRSDLLNPPKPTRSSPHITKHAATVHYLMHRFELDTLKWSLPSWQPPSSNVKFPFARPDTFVRLQIVLNAFKEAVDKMGILALREGVLKALVYVTEVISVWPS